MRSEIKRIRRPLTEAELASVVRNPSQSGAHLEESLPDKPLAERRTEAKKPLYLKRYE